MKKIDEAIDKINNVKIRSYLKEKSKQRKNWLTKLIDRLKGK